MCIIETADQCSEKHRDFMLPLGHDWKLCLYFIILFIISITQGESLFLTLHSIFISLKSVFLHLTCHTNSQNGRAKVRDGIISVFRFIVCLRLINTVRNIETWCCFRLCSSQQSDAQPLSLNRGQASSRSCRGCQACWCQFHKHFTLVFYCCSSACWGQFVKQKLMLSSSFRRDQIYKYEIYDFGHTFLCYLSQT